MNLKAVWTVHAGVIPGQCEPEFTKRWEYTSDEYERDAAIRELHEVAIFSRKRAEAIDYYQQVCNPQRMNWATVEFYWL